jgi:hypothetical protein
MPSPDASVPPSFFNKCASTNISTRPICCLPTELLTYVVKDISISDGINLSLTCRGLHLFMTPIIKHTLGTLSYKRAYKVIREIITSSAPTRQKATVLNIVVSDAHVRSLARRYAADEREDMYPGTTAGSISGHRRTVTTAGPRRRSRPERPEGPRRFLVPPDSLESKRRFWWDVLSNWKCIGYAENPEHFEAVVMCFDDVDTERFLAEWHMPFVEDWVIENEDCVLLEILGKNEWACLCESVNHSIAVALKSRGTERSMRMFETALRIGMYTPKLVRVMFLLTDFEVSFAGESWPWTRERGGKTPTTTAFEVCSFQPPNCETAAKILGTLLKTLKMGDIHYPEFSLIFLRHAFMVALRTAIEAGAATSLKLRVLETWLECCEDILVPEGHTKWRMALKLEDAVLLREILCARMVLESAQMLDPGNDDSCLDWRLKVELPTEL